MTTVLLRKRSELEIFDNLSFENPDTNEAYDTLQLKRQKTYSNSLLVVNDDTILGLLSKSEQLSCASSSTKTGGQNIPMSSNELVSKSNTDCRKKGTWSDDEDNILLNWIKQKGASYWNECSKLINGRTGKQCRERWINSQDPSIKKGNWSIEEQDMIFDNLFKYSTCWSSISKDIVGRTENSIKNYFYSSVRSIQSSRCYEYVRLSKVGCETTNLDFQFEQNENYDFSNLNHLAIKIIYYMRKINNLKNDTSQYALNENDKNFTEFLFKVIVDDRKPDKFSKRLIIKNDQGITRNSDSLSNKSNPTFGVSKLKNKASTKIYVTNSNTFKSNKNINTNFMQNKSEIITRNMTEISQFKPNCAKKSSDNVSFIKNYETIWPLNKEDSVKNVSDQNSIKNVPDQNSVKNVSNQNQKNGFKSINLNYDSTKNQKCLLESQKSEFEKQVKLASTVLLYNIMQNLNTSKNRENIGSYNMLYQNILTNFKEDVFKDNLKSFMDNINNFGDSLFTHQLLNSNKIETDCLNCMNNDCKNDKFVKIDTPNLKSNFQKN